MDIPDSMLGFSYVMFLHLRGTKLPTMDKILVPTPLHYKDRAACKNSMEMLPRAFPPYFCSVAVIGHQNFVPLVTILALEGGGA